MSNSQLNKLKTGIRNGTEVTLNLSSNMAGDFNDQTSFPHTLLLTDTQASRICKAFANGSSANKIFSKTQMSRMVQLGGVISDMSIFGNILSNLVTKGIDIVRGLGKYFLDN